MVRHIHIIVRLGLPSMTHHTMPRTALTGVAGIRGRSEVTGCDASKDERSIPAAQILTGHPGPGERSAPAKRDLTFGNAVLDNPGGELTWQADQQKRRFRVRECWDLSTHREPRNRTRRSVWE